MSFLPTALENQSNLNFPLLLLKRNFILKVCTHINSRRIVGFFCFAFFPHCITVSENTISFLFVSLSHVGLWERWNLAQETNSLHLLILSLLPNNFALCNYLGRTKQKNHHTHIGRNMQVIVYLTYIHDFQLVIYVQILNFKFTGYS